MIKTYPAILFRSGGLRADLLEPLSWANKKDIKDILSNELKIQSTRSDILLQLSKIKQTTKDYQLKVHLSNLHRDLYNQRSFSIARLERKLPVFDKKEEILDQLKSFEDLLQNDKLKREKFETEYADHLLSTLPILQKLAEEENLQKGLLMSSHSFYNRLQSLIKKEVTSFRKKEMQTTRRLWQYLTRIALKTSPFSTFTQLTWINFEDEKTTNLETEKTESRLLINNFVFAYLQELLEHYPSFYRSLHLDLNNSIQIDEVYEFILNSRNIESIQHLDKDEIVDLIYTWMKKQSALPSMQEVVNFLGEGIDADQEDLEEFVMELIEIGFLEWKWGISGMDTKWDEQLIKRLAEFLNDEFLNDLHQMLLSLRKNINEYARVDLIKRKSLQQMSCERLQKFWENHQTKKPLIAENTNPVFRRLTGSEFIFKPENIFYEDVKKQVDFKIKQTDIISVAELLNQVLKYLYPLKEDVKEYALNEFFKRHYTLDARPDFLSFYHHFNMANGALNTEEYILKVNDFRTKWKEALKKKLQLNKALVNFNLIDIELIYNDLVGGGEELDQQNSTGALIQPYLKEGELNFFIDACFSGFGKMFGRFLHLFPEKETIQLRKSVQDLEGEDLWIENTDASYFNANLHPPFLRHEINMPGSQNQLSKEQQIPIRVLSLRYNEQQDSVELFHSLTGKKVVIFDYGFESLSNRSPLYQFLALFTKEQATHLKLNELINELYPAKESGLIEHPRIVLEERYVLQRQKWYFPLSLLPFQKSGESNANYFLKINQWRLDYDLPEYIFYAINPTDIDTSAVEKDHLRKLKKDDYKPQFLNFSDPIGIQILSKNLTRVPLFLKIEEALPAPENFLKSQNHPYVSEFIMQWNTQ